MTASPRATAGLRDHLTLLRRRKWALIVALVVVPVAALAFSLGQQRLYEASSEVLVSRQNLSASLNGSPDPLASQNADRLVQTQAAVARVPEVARRTLSAVGVTDRGPEDLLDSSTVTAKADADILRFAVTDADPALAVRLATEYANEFTTYRRELDVAAILRARDSVRESMRDLRERGDTTSALFDTLLEREQQLSTLEALQTPSTVVRAASVAEQVQPRPVRNALIGVVLGLILGVAIALVRESLDTRVRTAGEIGDGLADGLPLLARLAPPPARLARESRLVTLVDPHSPNAEAFRVLRTNLEFARLGHDARTILVTSSVEQEGKSTTIANLAVTLARAGHRVALVDLDLRAPTVGRLFGLADRPGVTDVIAGDARLVDAMAFVDVDLEGHGSNGVRLGVLPAGRLPADPGELVGTPALAALLGALKDRADLVLIDAPPVLRVGDALTLSRTVDALIVVTRLGVVRSAMLTELTRLLTASPAAKLGFVVTGGSAVEDLPYGGYYGKPYGSRAPAVGREA